MSMEKSKTGEGTLGQNISDARFDEWGYSKYVSVSPEQQKLVWKTDRLKWFYSYFESVPTVITEHLFLKAFKQVMI